MISPFNKKGCSIKLVVAFDNLSLILLLLILPIQLLATVRLPGIFTDNMVIQRNNPFNIWGWAIPGETVSIKASWEKAVHATIAGQDSHWRISLQPHKTGGPYTIGTVGKRYDYGLPDNPFQVEVIILPIGKCYND